MNPKFSKTAPLISVVGKKNKSAGVFCDLSPRAYLIVILAHYANLSLFPNEDAVDLWSLWRPRPTPVPEWKIAVLRDRALERKKYGNNKYPNPIPGYREENVEADAAGDFDETQFLRQYGRELEKYQQVCHVR